MSSVELMLPFSWLHSEVFHQYNTLHMRNSSKFKTDSAVLFLPVSDLSDVQPTWQTQCHIIHNWHGCVLLLARQVVSCQAQHKIL